MKVATFLLVSALVAQTGRVSAQAVPYVADVTVSAHTLREKARTGCPVQTNVVDQDINEGAGGPFMYLCIRPTQYPAKGLTGIAIHRGRGDCNAGARVVAPDLNSGAGGTPLFLCLLNDSSRTTPRIMSIQPHVFVRAPVLPFDVICWDSARFTPVKYDSLDEPADLNTGAGGKYIYLCVRKSTTR